MTVEYETGQHV